MCFFKKISKTKRNFNQFSVRNQQDSDIPQRAQTIIYVNNLSNSHNTGMVHIPIPEQFIT